VNAFCTLAIGEVEEPLMRSVEACIEQYLGCPAQRLAPRAAVAGSYDDRRGQWNSALLLKQLREALPAGAQRILGVTEYDLFIPMLTFVYGQAQLGGEAALVSVARLRQEFHGLPPDRELTAARLRKETMHELGHTLGLIHCPEMSCVMSLSINLPQVDAKYEWYCGGCAGAAEERVASLRDARMD